LIAQHPYASSGRRQQTDFLSSTRAPVSPQLSTRPPRSCLPQEA
jgi:hypothetical protein